MRWIIGRSAPGPPSKNILAFVLLMRIGSALTTERIGIHALFGAFLLGVVMPREVPRLRCSTRTRNASRGYMIGAGGHIVMYPMHPIGHVRSPFQDTAEIPKGCGAKHEAEGTLEILPELERGLTDIDGFSHLFVIWVFDRSRGPELLATPPSDDRPHGVFATRSPARPNPIGLTVVELLRREGSRLHVRGVDMLDGTPILDIKPYLSSVPPEKLRRGWLAEAEARSRAQSG